jgi:hypothetical protein
MGEETHLPERRRVGLRDVSGTTIAVTSLAILGAAALVTTPLWLWRRHKRKRADALAHQPVRAEATPEEEEKDPSGS